MNEKKKKIFITICIAIIVICIVVIAFMNQKTEVLDKKSKMLDDALIRYGICKQRWDYKFYFLHIMKSW